MLPIATGREAMKAMETCTDDRHYFAAGREVCQCGKKNKHERCKCEKCGDEHWLRRNVDFEGK